jgi:hypothetical protein
MNLPNSRATVYTAAAHHSDGSTCGDTVPMHLVRGMGKRVGQHEACEHVERVVHLRGVPRLHLLGVEVEVVEVERVPHA